MIKKAAASAIALVVLTGFLSATPARADSAADLDRLVRNGAVENIPPADIQASTAGDIQPAAGTPAPADQATGDDAGEVIRITPDQTKVVRIGQDAASVIVANPAHANVVLDSPRLLVVMPRVPGTTSFTVLDANGNTIAEKTVIVSAAAKAKYMRIRRICNGQDTSCQPSAYFYCPDGCYEVMPVQPEGAPANAPDVAGNAAPAPADPALQHSANPNMPVPPAGLSPGDTGAPSVSVSVPK